MIVQLKGQNRSTMIRWKILQTLINHEDNSWEQLAKDALGENIHPSRKMGFFLSRQALRECLRDFDEHPEVYELKLKDYSLLPTLPQFTISLSHSKDCGVALVARRDMYRSVGVDIEHKEREVKDQIMERIAHPLDKKLRKIEIWCLKEAVFKTIMNTKIYNSPIEFSSIEILDKKWHHSDSGLKGDWELQEVHEYVMAWAYLKN
jgi:4'-phosphopantetheinyl transferase EntD